MPVIFDADGKEIGDIPLSDKQQTALEHGEEIVVLYHTPQLMHGVLGQRSGSFMLKKADDRLLTTKPDAVKEYRDIQATVAAIKARENV